MNPESLGKKLKECIAKCGWSIDECAEQIGISSKHLSDIERGNKVPKLATFIKILNTLSASAEDVLQDSLIIGYKAKSNEIPKNLNLLDNIRRKQALEIFYSVISALKES